MVVSKIVDLLDSSETGDDLVIPDMMFMQGKEPVGVSMALSLSSSSVSSHPIDGPPYHCSWRTVLVMAWTDANPGRCLVLSPWIFHLGRYGGASRMAKIESS
ncbi:unnamed protein product [Brassica oleracea]